MQKNIRLTNWTHVLQDAFIIDITQNKTLTQSEKIVEEPCEIVASMLH